MHVRLYGHVSHHVDDDYRVPLPIYDLFSRDDDDLPRVFYVHHDDPEIKTKSLSD